MQKNGSQYAVSDGLMFDLRKKGNPMLMNYSI